MVNRLEQLAERYLQQFSNYLDELSYSHEMLRSRLHSFRRDDDAKTRIDLESALAYFEQRVLPLLASRQEPEFVYEAQDRLILPVDGYWRAFEFRQLFEGVDYLNKIFMIDHKLRYHSPDFRLDRGLTRSSVYRGAQLHFYLAPREELRVRSIEFSSPGLVNFEGVGEVVREIRETFDYLFTGVLVKRVIDNFHEIRDRELRDAKASARRADEAAKLAEARARHDEAVLRQLEARSRIRRALRKTLEEDQLYRERSPQQFERSVRKLDQIGDITIEIAAHGLAPLERVEDSVMSSLSTLHHLTYEEEKIRLPRSAEGNL